VSAAAIIARAQAASVSLRAEGDKLRWRAPAPPPPDLGQVLALLRAHKEEVLRALRGGWFGPDSVLDAAVTVVTDVTHPAYEREPHAAWWRELYEERAAIREHDGGMSRADAEAGALADCVARWRALNPLSASGDGACVQCGKARPDTPVLARGGHAWLHRECWAPMNAARNEVAFAAVRALLGKDTA
jgi:hypothetical protein